MVTLCILVGLALALCGVTIACLTKKRGHEERAANAPPPLPPRVNVGIPSPTVSRTPSRTSGSSAVRALPPRRFSAVATAGAGCGPREIKPAQFPICPICKQRNVPGERQVIFWYSGENCYRCARGHRFKSNGKLL